MITQTDFYLVKCLWMEFCLNIFILHWLRNKFLTTYSNLSRFCFLGTTPVLVPNVWANEKIQKLTTAPGNQTQDLKIARLMLYLTTTDTTQKLLQNSGECRARSDCRFVQVDLALHSPEPYTPQILILTHQQQTAFENIVGKGRNCS